MLRIEHGRSSEGPRVSDLVARDRGAVVPAPGLFRGRSHGDAGKDPVPAPPRRRRHDPQHRTQDATAARAYAPDDDAARELGVARARPSRPGHDEPQLARAGRAPTAILDGRGEEHALGGGEWGPGTLGSHHGEVQRRDPTPVCALSGRGMPPSAAVTTMAVVIVRQREPMDRSGALTATASGACP